MPHAEHRGVRIWYEEVGSGPPLFLVQGLGLSSRFWLQLPQQLSGRFRVILVDNRGTGRSDRPRGRYSIRAMAGDTLAVADALGLERFAMAGISMGGMIAQEVALQAAPGRLTGLALLATTCGLPKGRIPPPSSILTLLRGAKRTPESLRAIRKLIVSAEAFDADPGLFNEFERLMAENPTTPAAFLRQLMGVSLHNTGGRLGQIRCPTLVVTGDKDRLVPPENSRIISRLIPGSRLEIVPGAGHAFPLERRELLGPLLTQFFAFL